MLRSATSLIRNLSFFPAHSLCPSPPLLRVPLFSFASSSSRRVLEMIKRESRQSRLDKICSDMALIPQQQRQQAVQAVLEKVLDGKFSPAAIKHEKFNIHLRRFPQQLYDAYFFRITQCFARLDEFMAKKDDRGRKLAVKEINESFATCFETVRKIEGKAAVLKQVDLLKFFAYYHVNYLFELVQSSKQPTCLKKAVDFHRSAVERLKRLIGQFETGSSQINLEDATQGVQALNDQNQPQNEQKYELIESIADSLIDIIEIQQNYTALLEQNKEKNVEEGQSQKQPEEGKEAATEENTQQLVTLPSYPSESLGMQPLISRIVQQYEDYSDRTATSSFYHKLRKLEIDLRFVQKMKQIKDNIADEAESDLQQTEEKRRYVTQIQALFNESLEDFVTKVEGGAEELIELTNFATFLVWMRLPEVEMMDIKDEQKFENIGLLVQTVVKPISQVTMRKAILNSILQELKATFNIEISGLVQAVPRSFRIGRVPRRSHSRQDPDDDQN